MSLLAELLNEKPAFTASTLSDYCLHAMQFYYDNMKKQYGSKYSGSGTELLEVTGCSTFIWNVLRYSYTKIGKKTIADQLKAMVMDGLSARHSSAGDFPNGKPHYWSKGLGAFLVDNGWKAHYWNPDVYKSRDMYGLDPSSTTVSKSAEEHKYSFQKVMGEIPGVDKSYYGVFPSGLIVGYNKTTKFYNNKIRNNFLDENPENLKKFKELEKEKLVVVIARGGLHTFLVSNGNVWEVHWDQLKDIKGKRSLMKVMRKKMVGAMETWEHKNERYVDVKKEILKNKDAWKWEINTVETQLYEKDTPFVEYEYLSGLLLTPPESTFTSRTIATLQAEASRAP
jgi:hypothetical protein